ncbi:hypothetical protein WA158_002313 [Blastocystis sp. Blastoise]
MSSEFSKIQADRFDPILFEKLTINTPEGSNSLSSVAQVVVKSPQLLSVSVFDPSLVATVFKTIKDSNLNANPQLLKNIIQIPIPKTTKEKREQLVKQMNSQASIYKQKVKNTRKTYMDQVKRLENCSVSKDQIKRYQNDIQKIVDKVNDNIDSLCKQKENELIGSFK